MLPQSLKIAAFLAVAWCWTSEARMKYDVACPGERGMLQCPEGYGIEVTRMDYGRKQDANCDARDQPALVSNKNCIHEDMTPWVKNLCHAKEYCMLPMPNSLMFVCDYSPDNFLQTSYICFKLADVASSVTCEGNSAKISCASSNKRIHVLNANFGRTDKYVCTNTPSSHVFCTSERAENTVKALCEAKEECNLPASVEQMGQPVNCDNSPHYLSVDYVCF
ncbi:L-rhamnose-binding lectin CSL3-like [Echeneis naucrates]|uniref:L-rhamnose-binding lectin CSL3-like n=1 Tax=Echeneis naucrates TaxID=173247 RepID=UPI00111330FD|nr:L-rhamnose-binding lectin CSL3-like [Echeneis naucrates]